MASRVWDRGNLCSQRCVRCVLCCAMRLVLQGFKESADAFVPMKDNQGNPILELDCVQRETRHKYEDLKITAARPKQFSLPAQASATFDTDGFTSGVLRLVPGSCKDVENTNLYFMVRVARLFASRWRLHCCHPQA